MNKPILFNISGGGNVVGYNYADNSWSCDGNNDDGFQEVNIDCHCAFPHMELMEGNWAPHMGASTTHGNAGYLTYLPQLRVEPVVAEHRESGDVGDHLEPAVRAAIRQRRRALQFDAPDLEDDRHRQRAREHGDVEPRSARGSRHDEHGQGQPAATSNAYTSTDGRSRSSRRHRRRCRGRARWLHRQLRHGQARRYVERLAAHGEISLPRRRPSRRRSTTRRGPAGGRAGKPWPWVGPGSGTEGRRAARARPLERVHYTSSRATRAARSTAARTAAASARPARCEEATFRLVCA